MRQMGLDELADKGLGPALQSRKTPANPAIARTSALTVPIEVPVDNHQRTHHLVNCRNQIGSISVNRRQVSRPG